MFKPQSNYQSPEALVLRFMREKRQLSFLHVGGKLGIKPKFIDYMENGQKLITQDDIILFLGIYNFSLDIFNEMLLLKPLNKQVANHFFITRT